MIDVRDRTDCNARLSLRRTGPLRADRHPCPAGRPERYSSRQRRARIMHSATSAHSNDRMARPGAKHSRPRTFTLCIRVNNVAAFGVPVGPTTEENDALSRELSESAVSVDDVRPDLPSIAARPPPRLRRSAPNDRRTICSRSSRAMGRCRFTNDGCIACGRGTCMSSLEIDALAARMRRRILIPTVSPDVCALSSCCGLGGRIGRRGSAGWPDTAAPSAPACAPGVGAAAPLASDSEAGGRGAGSGAERTATGCAAHASRTDV